MAVSPRRALRLFDCELRFLKRIIATPSSLSLFGTMFGQPIVISAK